MAPGGLGGGGGDGHGGGGGGAGPAATTMLVPSSGRYCIPRSKTQSGFTLFAEQRQRVESSESNAPSVVHGRNVLSHTNATVVTEGVIRVRMADDSGRLLNPRWKNLSPEIMSLDVNTGECTNATPTEDDGGHVGYARLTTRDFARDIGIFIDRDGGQAYKTFVSFVAGTLGKHVTDQVAAAIAADIYGPAGGSLAAYIYTPTSQETPWPQQTIFRNPKFWLSSYDTGATSARCAVQGIFGQAPSLVEVVGGPMGCIINDHWKNYPHDHVDPVVVGRVWRLSYTYYTIKALDQTVSPYVGDCAWGQIRPDDDPTPGVQVSVDGGKTFGASTYAAMAAAITPYKVIATADFAAKFGTNGQAGELPGVNVPFLHIDKNRDSGVYPWSGFMATRCGIGQENRLSPGRYTNEWADYSYDTLVTSISGNSSSSPFTPANGKFNLITGYQPEINTLLASLNGGGSHLATVNLGAFTTV